MDACYSFHRKNIYVKPFIWKLTKRNNHFNHGLFTQYLIIIQNVNNTIQKLFTVCSKISTKFFNNIIKNFHRMYTKKIHAPLMKTPQKNLLLFHEINTKENKISIINIIQSEMPNGLCMFPSLYRNVHNNSNWQQKPFLVMLYKETEQIEKHEFS